jgi:transposase InsO family protein
MKYAFIAEHVSSYPVERQCAALGVSVSGYYAWRKRDTSHHQAQDEQLLEQIRQVYQGSRRLYGSPRVHAALKRAGIACSRKRIARLMRQRRRPVGAPSQLTHAPDMAPNLLNRQFHADRPNQKWTADITYIPTAEGWLYLAAILDLFSRRLVGWAMRPRCDSTLVTLALHMALAHRHPGTDLLHHSDRGSQYTSADYTALLAQQGIRLSMSRTGNCYDNAVMESFFRTVKAECVHRNHYRSRQQAGQSLFDFLEVYYNRQRLHSTLGYLTPVEFEATYSL